MSGDAHDGDRHIDDGKYTFPDSVQVDRTWLTSGEHSSQGDVREAKGSSWENHDDVLEGERFTQRPIVLEIDETSPE